MKKLFILLIFAGLFLSLQSAQAGFFDWFKSTFSRSSQTSQVSNPLLEENSHLKERIKSLEEKIQAISGQLASSSIVNAAPGEKIVIKEVPVEKVVIKEIPKEIVREIIKEIPGDCPAPTPNVNQCKHESEELAKTSLSLQNCEIRMRLFSNNLNTCSANLTRCASSGGRY